LNSKAAFISFAKPMQPDQEDLIPPGSKDRKPDPKYAWRGRFLDLRTLAFALTGDSHTLDSACRTFGIPGKADPGHHGEISQQYIDYCRQDGAATSGLYAALLDEFATHPIALDPERAYSPASLSKAYLAGMGIEPLLARHRDFPREVLGHAMSAFYGGRAECRIRNHEVPVTLLDFTSEYPTDGALMDIHSLQIARHIDVVDATSEVEGLLGSLTLDDCFDPALWPQLVGFALIEPKGDVLPVRAAYDGKSWGIGVNPVTSSEPLWYSLADCAASALLTGRAPQVVRAVRLVPVGRVGRLKAIELRGEVEIDPMAQDPMVAMVEERQRVQDPRMKRDLKLIANAGSYGIYSEFNAREARKGQCTSVTVHGRKDEPFRDRVGRPEDPGQYCFPPFASCITGAARLMLAMLERCVTELGGTWAFCDTDSMAIVSTAQGGLVACPGGPERLEDGTPAIRALSHPQVEGIRDRFSALNPYDRTVVPQILKHEAQGVCLAVSAKRYALSELGQHGESKFFADNPPSEHGLGQYLNPSDPAAESKEWIRELWRWIVLTTHGADPTRPEWFGRPTMMRTNVTSPGVLRAFRHQNEGKPYPNRVKPFNFMMTAASAKPPERMWKKGSFRLVAPWEANPRLWEDLDWVDVHHPDDGLFRITTRNGRPDQPRVDTFAEVAAKYRVHPETKSLGPDGLPCSRSTVGLLSRRPVEVSVIKLIGKESNHLEERAAGELTIDDLDLRLTTYEDHDEWYRVILPRLRSIGASEVAAVAGMSERRAREVLAGRAFPHASHRRLMFQIVNDEAGLTRRGDGTVNY
jgi:hypothetical protein